MRVRPRDAGRWVAWLVLALCLTSAVLLRGGVDAVQWQYLSVVISLATAACLSLRSRRDAGSAIPPGVLTAGLLSERVKFRSIKTTAPRSGANVAAVHARRAPLELWLLSAVAAWMLLALVPLPPAIVSLLSPQSARWTMAARALTGADRGDWLPLSVAPPATFERLLFVLPAMAMFLAAREMTTWWTGRRVWIAVAPVVAVAVLEASLGLAQFNTTADGSSVARAVSGTYVNRNHYAGLLEMGFPLALTWALAVWTRSDGTPQGRNRYARRGTPVRPLGLALGAGALIFTAGCLLAGVIASLSRMGFLATLAAVATVALGWLLLRRKERRSSPWMWVLPLVLPLAVVLLVSTNAMVLRFVDTPGAGDITTDGRVQIWREAWQLFRAFPLTGAGLGTFEHALYPFRRAMPTNAVEYAHNDYLQLLTELGTIGFALTMALALWIVRRSLGAFREDAQHPWLGMGVLASLLAIGLHSLVDFNLYIPANALALAWLAGVAVSPALQQADA